MKKPYFFFLITLLFCKPVFAQQNKTASASVDKTSILIGEPVQLTVEASFSNAHATDFFTLDSLPHFEILNRSRIDTQTTNAQTTLKQIITLTSWDSGAWLVPAFSIASVKGFVTKPLAINVTYTPASPTQDYHDIKDIIAVQKPPRSTWYWYVISAVILLLLVLLLFPKKKAQTTTDTTVIREGAYKQALKELDVLKNTSAPDNTTYFTELIRIFRTYLEQGKGIHSFQQTTGDLSRQLAQLSLPHEDLKKLVETLQLSDFVKFAQYNAASDEREKAWDEIKRGVIAIEGEKK